MKKSVLSAFAAAMLVFAMLLTAGNGVGAVFDVIEAYEAAVGPTF